MTPLIHDYHVRVLLPCYRETPEMVRISNQQAPLQTLCQHSCPKLHAEDSKEDVS